MSAIANILTHLGPWRSDGAYDRLLSRKLRANRGNRDLAFAQAIGATSLEMFHAQGDVHVQMLRHHGLADGMTIFDLGCGCGRTAQALQRAGWQGSYTGTDIVQRFVEEVERKCSGYRAFVHRSPSIAMPDASVDMLYHWSVFTHITPEECFLYMEDTFRALKPGGKLVFSFLELGEPAHREIFDRRVRLLGQGKRLRLLDAFLHRDWIRLWAQQIGFSDPQFTDGLDGSNHVPSWQALAALVKPQATMI